MQKLKKKSLFYIFKRKYNLFLRNIYKIQFFQNFFFFPATSKFLKMRHDNCRCSCSESMKSNNIFAKLIAILNMLQKKPFWSEFQYMLWLKPGHHQTVIAHDSTCNTHIEKWKILFDFKSLKLLCLPVSSFYV